MRALGVDIDKKNGPTLPLDLATIRSLLDEGINPDRCRDRSGNAALGMAAYLGRTDAMLMLLEYGADVDSENLDGTSALSMAVFGKSAAAVALLLAFNAESDTAWSDAQSMSEKECLRVFDYWSQERAHPLLTRAYQMAESIQAKRAEAEAERASHPGEEAAMAPRLEAAEAQARAAETRAELAEAKVVELERRLAAMQERAVTAEKKAAEQKPESGHPSLASRLRCSPS